MHLSVQSYRGSVRAHIDFGSYSKTHTDSWARTQLPPPRGVPLINELKVQRCFVCERYMKVISPPLFCSREEIEIENYRTERLGSIWFLPLCSLVRCASYPRAEGDAFQLSPSSASIYDLQKELFKETKIDQNLPQSVQTKIHWSIDLAKMKMSITMPRFDSCLQGASNRFPGSHGSLSNISYIYRFAGCEREGVKPTIAPGKEEAPRVIPHPWANPPTHRKRERERKKLQPNRKLG